MSWGMAHLGTEVIILEGRDEVTWIFREQWWGGGGPRRVMRQGRSEGLYPGEVRMKQNRKWKKESSHLKVWSSLETS